MEPESFLRFADPHPEAMILVERGGTILVANDAARRVFPAATAGTSLATLVDGPAGELDRYLGLCARNRTMVPGGLRIRTASGSEPYRCDGALVAPAAGSVASRLLLRLVPRRESGTAFLELNRRIDELREEIERRKRVETALAASEAVFRNLFETSLDAIVIVDGTGRFVDANAAACELFGRPRDEILSLRNHDVVQEPDSLGDEWERFLESGEARGETVLARPGREPVTIEYAARADFVPGRHLAVLRDVSERRAAEEALREADRKKNEFLALLAHELRNPLAPLSQALELARRDEHRAEALDLASRQLRHLVRLVDDLLDVARITRGQIGLQRQTLDLRDVVREALASQRSRIEERGQRLEVALPDETLPIFGDAMRLEQIVVNLVANSWKYSPPGARITVEAEATGSIVRLWVRDEGIGIPAAVLPHLFEPFVAWRPTREGGLGLGLALVKRLVELHGGRVTARSEGENRGTEIRIELPRAKEPAGAVPPTGAPRAAERGSAGNLRILVADDNQDAAVSLAALLELSGYEVVVVGSGAEVLAATGSSRFDVLLLDIGLPDFDGREVARRVRSGPHGADLLVVAISGFGQEEDRRRAAEAGIDRYLVKPVEIAELEEILRARAREGVRTLEIRGA